MLRAELDGGGTPTVWFTASAVGVPEGRSGKVTGLDDTNEGDFIQVRPAGSKDVLSFSAAEVTLEKPPRKRKEAPATKSGTAPKASGQGKRSDAPAGTQASSGSKATAGPRPSTAAKAEATKSGTSASSQTRSPAAAESRGVSQRAQSQAAGKATPAKTGRRKQPGEATVTVTADESGQWSVEVTTGKKRVLKPTSVSASAVAEAAKALHEDVAEAVEPVVEAARDKQRERVEQLQQELAEAQRKLDDLG